MTVPPPVGLGCWKIPQAEAPTLVREAIRVGYRHIDCACDYGNEVEVGAGIRAALEEGLCRREDLWVTSKLWNSYHAPEHVRPACERSLRDLGLKQFDLYLVHFPIATKFVPFEERYPPGWLYDPSQIGAKMEPATIPLADTWKAMEDLVRAGLTRYIGVSNYSVALIRETLATCTIQPAVSQVEMHPYLAQQKLLRYCRENLIAVTAFSPLGAPSYVPLGMAAASDSVLERPEVKAIAERHGKTPAQVVLCWGIQRGTSVIPKTSRPERLVENLASAEFTLSDTEMATITAFDQGRRFNDPGVFCEQAFGTFFPTYD